MGLRKICSRRPASSLPVFLLLAMLSSGVHGLGGYRHRNRQNPSAYYGWGYGPGRDFAETDDRRTQEDVLEALLTDTEPPGTSTCFGRRCTINDKCCPGAVCVDMDEFVGTCLPTYGARKGEPCRHDDDCAPGLFCTEMVDNGINLRVCQSDRHNFLHKKQYNEKCEVSSECDVAKGLCCQLQRRHRQAPRKVCVYYKDPGNCLGNMEGAPPPPIQDLPKASPLKSRLG